MGDNGVDEYHTALGGPATRDWPAVELYQGRRGTAFQHDVCLGVHERMLDADVLYVEFPWPDGYTVFAERAGTTQRLAYRDLVSNVGTEILRCGRPAVLLVGKRAAQILQPPAVASVRLNGNPVLAALWRLPGWEGTPDAHDILRRLAGEFACVGDFCCGYGRAGRVFHAAGKRYVLSDFDPHCIGHIAAHEPSWQ